MGLVMPPKEYRSLIDDFVQVVKWTAITFFWLLLILPVLLISCCCLGLVLEPIINKFRWGDCEVQQSYGCGEGIFLIYNDEGLLLDREFKWVEPPKRDLSGGLKDHDNVGWDTDFSRLDCLQDQDAFHVLDAECTEVIFRYEGRYRIVDYCNGG